ncbi:MAG: hypothetical protein H7Z19_16070 [Chitinophagaceae bacterium]|nr:hypothetical protein [Rubrivivax sp.]
MKSLSRVFKPLQQAAQAFFGHDLALRRGEGGVAIVLEQRAPEEGLLGRARRQKKQRIDEAAQKETQTLALMLEQLAQVLGEQPDTRGTLRHLAFVEKALGKKGLKALNKLPLDVLQRALEQLEGLVTNWSPVGLATLRSKMAVAVIEREQMDDDGDAKQTSAFLDCAELVDEGPAQPPAQAPAGLAEDDAALAAAYAAIGAGAVAAPLELPELAFEVVEVHSELGSRSAKGTPRTALPSNGTLPEIKLRELQD